jgi:hypothetical protein
LPNEKVHRMRCLYGSYVMAYRLQRDTGGSTRAFAGTAAHTGSTAVNSRDSPRRPTAADTATSSTPSAPSTEEGQPPDILEAAAAVITALKEKDMDQLAAWVHPERGIRFSPFAYVDTVNDLVFTKDEVDTLLEDPAKRVWRLFEGTGEVIELNFADYYKWYIYDADFEQDAGIAVNKELRKEQTSGNLNEVYPEANHDFVEYYIGGLDLAEEGMDWRSLYLVFETNGDDHALVGIIHDQWTP